MPIRIKGVLFCEICGRMRLSGAVCKCIERSPNEKIRIIIDGVSERSVVDSPVFGRLVVRGIGFKWPECNEVVKDPFLELAVFWVEYPDGSSGWMDFSLRNESPNRHVEINGWNEFRLMIERMYPSANRNKIIEFVEKIASNEFRKKHDRDECGKQMFFELFGE